MNIGIDFYDTITDEPIKFRRYVRTEKTKGNKVYVISAIHKGNLARLQKDFKHARPGGELVPVYYTNYGDVPKLKYDKCKEFPFYIDYMIDDRQDTCDYLSSRGIKTKKYVDWKTFNDK